MTSLAVVIATVSGLTSCKSDASTEVTASPGTLAGWTFALTGATISALFGVPPVATNSFAAPVVSLSGQPVTTGSVTMSVAAAEPFTTIYVQPVGATQYLRVTLPTATTLIGIQILRVADAPSTATSLKIAVENGSRTSLSSTLFLLVPVAN